MVVNLRRIIISSRFNDVMCVVIIYSKEHVHSIVTTNLLYRTSYQLWPDKGIGEALSEGCVAYNVLPGAPNSSDLRSIHAFDILYR